MDCVFCDLTRMVVENELAYAIYDQFPVSQSHMLIIPKRHVSSFFESTKEEKRALFELLDECKELIEKNNTPDGYNIGINVGGAAGQTIMHLHIHLIPRYFGDVENPRGGVRGAIPEKRIY